MLCTCSNTGIFLYPGCGRQHVRPMAMSKNQSSSCHWNNPANPSAKLSPGPCINLMLARMKAFSIEQLWQHYFFGEQAVASNRLPIVEEMRLDFRTAYNMTRKKFAPLRRMAPCQISGTWVILCVPWVGTRTWKIVGCRGAIRHKHRASKASMWLQSVAQRIK